MFRVIRNLLILSSFVAISSAQSVIHLKTRIIETNPSASVDEIASPNPRGAGHLLLQFGQHPTAAMVRALERRGVKVLGDVPDNGLLVSLDRRANIAGLRAHYAAPIRPRDKISPLVTSSGYFLVEFHPDTDMNQARGTLLNMGLVPVDNPDLNPIQLMLYLAPEQSASALATLTSLDEVAYVFPASHELIQGIPAPFYVGALTTNGPTGQAIPDLWKRLGRPRVGLGRADVCVQSRDRAARFRDRRVRDPASYGGMVKSGRDYLAVRNQPRRAPRRSIFYSLLMPTATAIRLTGQAAFWRIPFTPRRPIPNLLAGDMHFDDSESWHIGVNTDLFSVALHELGTRAGPGPFRRSHCRHVSLLQDGHDFGCSRQGCHSDALRCANFHHGATSARLSLGVDSERGGFYDDGVERQLVGSGRGRDRRDHRYVVVQ